MTTVFDEYVRRLRETAIEEQTEHTGRTALEELLRQLAPKGVEVQQEPRRQADKGAPDFKIRQRGSTLGYVEVKAIGTALDPVLKSDQIRRYRELSDNIVLTNYLEWLWLDGNGVRERATLCYPTDLEGRTIRVRPDNADAVAKLLDHFFAQLPERIGRSEELALALAKRSRLLRDALTSELVRQEKEKKGGRLLGLLDVFRKQVFHDLSVAEFADAFAQMLAYGLFLARLNAPATEVVDLRNAEQFVPGAFRLIRELVEFLKQLNESEYDDMKWIVDEVLSIVNSLDLAAIHEDLSFRGRKAISRKVRAKDEEEYRLFERDPFIYFYEDYLKVYDKEMRKSRGVYYTPPPVVNFIVRAVDDLLKDRFGIRDGLADHDRVTVLDFACGTGTFLLEVMRQIFDNIGGPEAGTADLVVRDHMLKNLYGFEYLIAPYTIAHLKLSHFLTEQGHPLSGDERLQVFLTNTLEPIEPQSTLLLPALSAEVESAQAVKDKEILVILGNPPYSGHSRNKGESITRAIDGYKYTIEVDANGHTREEPLGERNPKWLNDDYVKFIRFAQLKMDREDEGIVGIITNHSWLDNPTFRGMRQSLMRTFDQIYVLDLHGSTKRRERAPDGGVDENVFDIQQGVAITLLIKRAGVEPGVWRADLWGDRLGKYRALASTRFDHFGFDRLQPGGRFRVFAREEPDLRHEYEKGWRLPDIFPMNVLGFQTHRDHFAIAFSKEEMRERLQELADPAIADEEIARRWKLKSNRDWSLGRARIAARDGRALEPVRVAYRPFDNRWAEFGPVTMDYPRRELMDHVAGHDNICLLAPRSLSSSRWQHALVTELPPNDCVISSRSREANQSFPLFTYNTNRQNDNISNDLQVELTDRYDKTPAGQDIFGYAYAVMFAATYRERYGGFLRIDFPRIPFSEDAEDFESLAPLGWELVQAHLLRNVPHRGLARLHGRGDYSVGKLRWVPSEEAVWINDTQKFAPLPEPVWAFWIGSYQVLEKYLKSRRGRTLTLDEVNHIGRVADALAFTIDQMERIDEAYRAAFPEHVEMAD